MYGFAAKDHVIDKITDQIPSASEFEAASGFNNIAETSSNGLLLPNNRLPLRIQNPSRKLNGAQKRVQVAGDMFKRLESSWDSNVISLTVSPFERKEERLKALTGRRMVDGSGARVSSAREGGEFWDGMEVFYDGYLYKKGRIVRSTKRRFFRLTATNLIYFEDDRSTVELGKIQLSDLMRVNSSDFEQAEGKSDEEPLWFSLVTLSRTLELRAENRISMVKWIEEIRHAAGMTN